MRNDKENLIVKLTFEFALDIIAYSESIRNNNRFEMASQIFRCGTSIGANIKEAQNAESKADFIHKFKISAKEADELQYFVMIPLTYLKQFHRQHKNFVVIFKMLSLSSGRPVDSAVLH